MNPLKQFFGRYKDELIVALLLVYVALLGLGVAGELLDIEWILNLPLYKL